MSKKNLKKKEIDNSLEGRFGLVYARVSGKRQEREGNGLESQEGRCKSQLKYLDVPYERSFYDTYTGGVDFVNRPAMQELLKYIDEYPNRRFVVLFDDLKRFAREVAFHFKLKTAFKERNVILICLNYKFDDSPEGWFSELIMAGQAELERLQNKRQVIQKQTARLESGYWPFVAKKGYVMKKTSQGKLSVPHKTQGKTLARALEGFANGEFVRPIDACKFLIASGFWHQSRPEKYVQKFTQMLSDPFYCGDIYYPERDISRRKGLHKPLIAKETFDLIQRRLNPKSINKKIRKDVSDDFPMRGLIICSICQKHLTAGWTKGRSNMYGYYFCSNPKCKSYRKSCSKSEVEGRFLDILKDNISDKEYVEIEELFVNEWDNEMSLLSKRKGENEAIVKSLEQKIERLTNMIIEASTESLRTIYQNQIEKMAVELDDFTANHIDLDDQPEIYRTALYKLIHLLKNPYEIWLKVDIVEKHRLYFFLFEQKLQYDQKEGYRTVKSPYYSKLFETKTSVLSEMVHLRLKTYNQIKELLIKFWEYYLSSAVLKQLLN